MLNLRAKKILKCAIVAVIMFFLHTPIVEPGTFIPYVPASNAALEHIVTVLKDVKPGDLTFCLGYIKKSDHSNQDIAKFIQTWSPDLYARQIPSVFRSKIDRVIGKLSTIDYQQLLIDIDFIKNSQITITDMVKLINGTNLGKKS